MATVNWLCLRSSYAEGCVLWKLSLMKQSDSGFLLNAEWIWLGLAQSLSASMFRLKTTVRTMAKNDFGSGVLLTNSAFTWSGRRETANAA